MNKHLHFNPTKHIPRVRNNFRKSIDFSYSSGWKTLKATLPGTRTSFKYTTAADMAISLPLRSVDLCAIKEIST